MKVLSLFDGISCGYLAFQRANIPIERYCAFEIDKNALKISEKNFPNIEHYGSVVGADFSQFKGFDIIIAGFPCQDLSISGKRAGLKGERSGLFWELVRAIEEVQPKYFLVENNYNMPKDAEKIITETLGVSPVMINSAAFSAQQRKRLYWTNIPVKQPKICNIHVEDILEDNVQADNKFDKVIFNGKEEKYSDKPLRVGVVGKDNQTNRVYSIKGKSVTFTTSGHGFYLIDKVVRTLTPIEAERLQTLPDNYTEGITKTARIKAIGNGWTVDVISYILKGVEKQ